jgi:hypothetical protein
VDNVLAQFGLFSPFFGEKSAILEYPSCHLYVPEKTTAPNRKIAGRQFRQFFHH